MDELQRIYFGYLRELKLADDKALWKLFKRLVHDLRKAEVKASAQLRERAIESMRAVIGFSFESPN